MNETHYERAVKAAALVEVLSDVAASMIRVEVSYSDDLAGEVTQGLQDAVAASGTTDCHIQEVILTKAKKVAAERSEFLNGKAREEARKILGELVGDNQDDHGAAMGISLGQANDPTP